MIRRIWRKTRRQLKSRRITHSVYRRVKGIPEYPFENLYHCCTQKTASQWFRTVFSDPTMWRYTGLAVCRFAQAVADPRVVRLQDARFERPLPVRSVGTPLYVDYPTYLGIEKPKRHEAFFVLRDPRDIVVSWYFSVRYSHPTMGAIPELRTELLQLSLHEGLRYSIDRLEWTGLFSAQRSWLDVSEMPQNIRIFRYEDLARDNKAFLKELLGYLGVEMPGKEMARLYERHRYERYSGGRPRGEESTTSHYRKGVAGDWRNCFDDATLDHFRLVTGDLLEVLEYADEDVLKT